MNISSISFCGNNNNQSRYTYRDTESQRFVDELRREAGFDSFQKQPESTIITTSRKNGQHHFNPYKTICLFAAALKLLSVLHSCASEPQGVVDVNAKAGENLADYAFVYNVDEDAIKDYNNLTSSVLGNDTVLSIPSAFDPVGEKIAQYTIDLYGKGVDEEEQAELVEDIEQLRAIQQLQSEIATMYSDGKYAYFLITLPTDETATETQAGYGGCINVEEFKEIFGIKDGVIKDHNDISYTWGGDEYGSYMDFTVATLSDGQTIKVPVGAVDVKYIDELND